MQIEEGAVPKRGAQALGILLDQLASWREQYARGTPPPELLETVLSDTGYREQLAAERTIEATGRLENLVEFNDTLMDFDNLDEFLEQMALVGDDEGESQEPRVSLMTIHAAKGLEFEVVFLAGWEDEVFPSPRAIDAGGKGGCRGGAAPGPCRRDPRDKRHLAISSCANRFSFGQMAPRTPSRFIYELPEEALEKTDGSAGETRREFSNFSVLENKAARADAYRSPGWRRMQRMREFATSDGKASRPAPQALPSFDVGARVFHKKFGYGRVVETEGVFCTVFLRDRKQAGQAILPQPRGW